MDDRLKKRTEWVVGQNEVGQAVLNWTVDPAETAAADDDRDPLARTHNFLQRLEVPGLELEDDKPPDDRDPYNSGVWHFKR